MARPSLVCLCRCCLPAFTVALGLDIQFAPVYNATFQTASVSQYFEQSTAYLSSALCRQIPLWFCKVTPPNFPDQRAYTDSDTGISLSAHRGEIDHHDLNPTSLRLRKLPFFGHTITISCQMRFARNLFLINGFLESIQVPMCLHSSQSLLLLRRAVTPTRPFLHHLYLLHRFFRLSRDMYMMMTNHLTFTSFCNWINL